MTRPEFQGLALTTELARRFMWAGAALGAVGAGLLAGSIVVEPGVIVFYMMGGAGVGGLAGFLLGALKGSRREESPRARR
jgi:hypothetical protein